jgi:hypothetical protein
MAYQSSGSSSSSGFQLLNSPFGDTTYTKVFVGGLAWETQSETMRRYFEQFGDILEAVVITDKNTGRSKGYGFVRIFIFINGVIITAQEHHIHTHTQVAAPSCFFLLFGYSYLMTD